MCPHLGQRTLLLCALKVNCFAIMGIARQTGTNWHEWAWQRPLCRWRRSGRQLSMCPCLWIMCSTFSKAQGQKMSDRQQHWLSTQARTDHQRPQPLYTKTYPTPLRLNRTHMQYTLEPHRTQPSTKQTNSTYTHTPQVSACCQAVCILLRPKARFCTQQ